MPHTGLKLAQMVPIGALAVAALVSGFLLFADHGSASASPFNAAAAKSAALSVAASDEAKLQAEAKARGAVKPDPTAAAASASLAAASDGSTTRTGGGLNTQVHGGPMHAAQFTVTDSWQGLVGAQWLYLIAGANPGDDTGSVALYSLPVNPNDGSDPALIGTYERAGTTMLTITSVTSGVATLTTATGTAITFDLTSHQYH